MIVVTVGTQFFDELIHEVDRLIASGVIRDRVWAQIGLALQKPAHMDWVPFDRHLLDKAQQAGLIITHAGTGSLCEFVTLGRPLIAVVNPTKAANHQLEFVRELSGLFDFCWIDSPKKLLDALPRARPPRPRRPPTIDALARDIRNALWAAR